MTMVMRSRNLWVNSLSLTNSAKKAILGGAHCPSALNRCQWELRIKDAPKLDHRTFCILWLRLKVSTNWLSQYFPLIFSLFHCCKCCVWNTMFQCQQKKKKKMIECWSSLFHPGVHQRSLLKSDQHWDRSGRKCGCCSRGSCLMCQTAKICLTKSLCPLSLEQKSQVTSLISTLIILNGQCKKRL